MTLYLRFIYFWLALMFRPKCKPEDSYDVPFRVWPTDLDLFFHMNNAKYFSVMDLARVTFLIRSGFWKKVRKHGYYGVLAGQWIDYHRSLELFEKFIIRSHVIGWDDKFIYTAQDFIRDGKVVASATVCIRFLKKTGGGIDPHELLGKLGMDKVSPPLPREAIAWRKRRYGET